MRYFPEFIYYGNFKKFTGLNTSKSLEKKIKKMRILTMKTWEKRKKITKKKMCKLHLQMSHLKYWLTDILNTKGKVSKTMLILKAE